MANKITEKTFKISDLLNIKLSDLDGCDSLLISDFDNKSGKWFTKRLTILQLLNYLTQKDASISSLINDLISASIEPDGILRPTIDELSGKIDSIDSELSNKVTAWVQDELLCISKNKDI